jgi:RNA polymerase sigma-70 factor (ECF subfamily)
VISERGRTDAVITTDLELIEQVRSGNEEAFARLVKHYTPYVYRTAFAFLHDEHESEDVAQEIFLKVYRSIQELQDILAFNAWIKRITTNSCLDRLRKQRPTPVPDHQLNQIMGKNSQKGEQLLEIKEAISQLIPEYREALILREWQGYDYQEIATLLSIPLGTVKSRIHGARVRLRKILSE